RDEDLVQQGKVIGKTFDRVFLCEDHSVRRDLPETEARALLKKGLYEGRRVTKIIDEGTRRAAVDAALSQLVAGGLLVLPGAENAIDSTVEQVHQWMGRSGRRA